MPGAGRSGRSKGLSGGVALRQLGRTCNLGNGREKEGTGYAEGRKEEEEGLKRPEKTKNESGRKRSKEEENRRRGEEKEREEEEEERREAEAR